MPRIARPEEAAQMRTRLMRAAYAAIAERGFAAVTLQDVATRAGVSKALVLYYFTDKEQLLAAVMERTDQVIRSRAERAMREAAASGPLAQLDAYLDALTIGAREHRDFYRVFLDFMSAGLRSPAIGKSTRSFHEGCAELERETIQRGIAAGIFRRDLIPAEASTVVRALIDGLSIQWLLRGDEPFDQLRRRMREAVLAYLGA